MAHICHCKLCLNYLHFCVDCWEAAGLHDESEINFDSNIHVCHDSHILITLQLQSSHTAFPKTGQPHV